MPQWEIRSPIGPLRTALGHDISRNVNGAGRFNMVG